MSKNNPTFEEVDKHVQSADLSAFQPGGKHQLLGGATTTAALDPTKLCASYVIIKPILSFFLPMMPKKWQDAVKTFMQIMDVLCPIT